MRRITVDSTSVSSLLSLPGVQAGSTCVGGGDGDGDWRGVLKKGDGGSQSCDSSLVGREQRPSGVGGPQFSDSVSIVGRWVERGAVGDGGPQSSDSLSLSNSNR